MPSNFTGWLVAGAGLAVGALVANLVLNALTGARTTV